MISRKRGLRLGHFAFAHEGESYLILGGGRLGRLHGILGTYAILTHEARRRRASRLRRDDLAVENPQARRPHAPRVRSLELKWHEFRAIRARVRVRECGHLQCARASLARGGVRRPLGLDLTNEGRGTAALKRHVGRCLLSRGRHLSLRCADCRRLCRARLHGRRRSTEALGQLFAPKPDGGSTSSSKRTSTAAGGSSSSDATTSSI